MKKITVPPSHSYKKLPQDLDSSHSVKYDRCGMHWCPKVTRLKVISVLVLFLIVASLLFLYTWHGPGLSVNYINCCDIVNYTSTCLPTTHSTSAKPEQLPTFVEIIDEDVYPSKNLRAKHQKRRLPQCLIIGVRKGGTRALLEFLNIHPNIQAARTEIHFFDYEENYMRGIDWYRKRMPYSYADQITLEKSPSYFVEDEVPHRIHQMNSSIKLLLIVRNPIERAVSDYLQIVVNKINRNKTYQSFEQLAFTDAGEVSRSYNAIKRSVYHKFFRKWLNVFPRNQFHVVDGENFARKPLEELRLIEDFLGLQHKIKEEHIYYNKTRGFHCIQSDTRQKCLSESKGRQHPELSPEAKEKLHEFFRPLNKKFYNLVGRSFQWL